MRQEQFWMLENIEENILEVALPSWVSRLATKWKRNTQVHLYNVKTIKKSGNITMSYYFTPIRMAIIFFYI